MSNASFLQDNWYWAVAALGSGSALAWLQWQDARLGNGLSPTQAVQWMNKDKAWVIDVRDANEFAQGHVAGARNLPLASLGQGKGLPSNKKLPLVVVCAQGKRAAQAASKLRELGHEQVEPLAGGLDAWRQANLPIERD